MAEHHFTPDHYHSALGTYDPVLRIADGDTVVTTTLDAGGGDSTNTRLKTGGNPQTGPFYVEGAEPGDTLVVRLDRIRPNRSQGFSASRLSPNVVDPRDVLAFPPDGNRELVTWEVDTDAWTAKVTSPANLLGELELALRPMIGCFGVAPPGAQAISTATSGPHGGNMDYNGFVEGVSVHFPVFVPGALFFLGDGHATQGDGEIVGTGIEISCDVQFTLRVRKGKEIRWPRCENASHIMTVGNARPLEQALQHATSEMVRWLQEDYELAIPAVHTFMGQCVEYAIGNVFDPAYTIVCKISKESLGRI